MTSLHADLNISTMNVPSTAFTEISSAEPGSKRRLMVSDNPENLDAASFPAAVGTLWYDKVNTSERSVTHRVFGWHHNKMGRMVHIGLIIENTSETNQIQIRQIHRELRLHNHDWLIHIGQSLATLCLSGMMEAFTADDHQPFAKGVSLVESTAVSDDLLYGFIYEFTIVRTSGTGNLDYIIRTVASQEQEADIRSITSEPLPSIHAHPRGSWPYSETIAQMSPYTVGEEKLCRLCTKATLDGAAPADLLFTSVTSEMKEGAVNNIGQFGVNYTVNIPIINNTNESKMIRISLNARGGKYAGAAAIDGRVYGIPTLSDNTEGCYLADYTAPVGTSTFSFQIMHAGDSMLPIGIFVTTI
ncbi:hypothetical protein [Paenibacillus abyssi]|uniref:Uncharacterized protein n=1 Tax=Paenibacillus abyssi TaxID=1340531 RepID=A0A917CSV4_9BACL|nr:hypothetical protein [Paenibacillus abyssi]GGF95815.1 hypothetical protein GCM10010916_11440 [Paenibacillus abyssi]